MQRKINHIEIIKECLKGTQSSFKVLYDAYKGYVYTICVRYGVSDIEIKDQMQIIFMEVFKSLKNYDSEKSQFKTWLSRITINQILMQKRKKQIDYTDIDDVNYNLIESDLSIEIENRMDEANIHEILKEMPVQFITVFNLFIIDGYSHKEIAKKLDIPENTSRTLLHRGRVWAMKMLKIRLKDRTKKYKIVK